MGKETLKVLAPLPPSHHHHLVIRGTEEDADQLLLADKLLQAVLAEDLVVCVGQPKLIAGDLNAGPAVITWSC